MSSRTLLPLLALVAAAPAAAQGFRGVEPYGSASGADGGDRGHARAFVRGAYVGAPLTRFPRPTQIVPTPWSYGTYGVPTVSGIPPAPVAQPTLTVIDGRGPAASARRGEGWAMEGRAAGARVIEVRVPRR